jgi:hypothetical protein
VLAVNDVDPLVADHPGQKRLELRVQPLVLEVVAHVGNVRRRGAEFEDAEALVAALAVTGGTPGPRLDDEDRVAACAEPFRQLEGAPSAAAADRRERVGREQDLQRIAASRAAQCADQL